MTGIGIGDVVRHRNSISCMTVKVVGITRDWAEYAPGHRLDDRFSTPLPDLEKVFPFVDDLRDDEGHLLKPNPGLVPDFLEVPFAINLRPHNEVEYRSAVHRLSILRRAYDKAPDKAAFRKAYDEALIDRANRRLEARWRTWQDEIRRRGGLPALSEIAPAARINHEPRQRPQDVKWFFGD